MKRPTFITWEQIRVSAVIAFALLVIGVAMYKLGQSANLFTKHYRLYAFLPSANGLRPGGQVTLAGQLAGTVQEIRFLPVDTDTTRNLMVVMEVDRDLRQQIRDDSRARLRTMGLLGDRLLDISPGTPAHRALADGDTIALGESVDYEQLMAQASGAVGDLVRITQDMHALTSALVAGKGTIGALLTDRHLYDQLDRALVGANTTLARFQSTDGTLGRLLEDPTLYGNLTAMVASVDTLVGQMRSREGTFGRMLQDDSLYRHLVSVTTGADSIVRQISRGNGTANKLLTDQALYDQLVKTVTDLNAILADVRRDPGRYTKGLVRIF